MNAADRWRQSTIRIEQLLADPATREEAVTVARGALAQAEQDFGEADDRVLAARNLLGTALNRSGRYDEALAEYQRCSDQCVSRGQARSMTMAVLWANVAAVWLAQAKYDEATRYYELALDLKRELVGPVHASVASSICDLAHVEERRGRFERAMDLYLQGLELYCATSSTGEPPGACVNAVVACARQLQARAEYEAALRGYLALRPRLRPPGVDPFILQCLIELGRREQALPYLLTTLEMPENRDNANLWRMLGLLRLAVDRDVEAAVRAWSNALERDPFFGARYPDVAAFVSMHRAMAATGRPLQPRIEHVDLATGQFVVVLN